jgi:hypothetical protein
MQQVTNYSYVITFVLRANIFQWLLILSCAPNNFVLMQLFPVRMFRLKEFLFTNLTVRCVQVFKGIAKFQFTALHLIFDKPWIKVKLKPNTSPSYLSA